MPSNPGKRVRASRIYFGITSAWLRERHEWFFLTNHKALQSKTKATQITFDTQTKIAHEKQSIFRVFKFGRETSLQKNTNYYTTLSRALT